MAEKGKDDGKEMKLKIIACTVGYTGTNARGDEYSIYEIRAEKPDGTPINEKLRSFGALPIGQMVEVTVKPYVSEKYGTSFTLSAKKGSASASAAAINSMQEQIAALSVRVEALEGRLASGRDSTAAPVVAGAVVPPDEPMF